MNWRGEKTRQVIFIAGYRKVLIFFFFIELEQKLPCGLRAELVVTHIKLVASVIKCTTSIDPNYDRDHLVRYRSSLLRD